MLGECRAIFANARNTAQRLAKFNGLDGARRSTIRRGWPRGSRPGPYGDYVLSVGRIESVKRVDLLVRAMAMSTAPIRLVVAGDGTQRANVERLAESLRRRRSRRRSSARRPTSSCSISTPARWRCSIRPSTRTSAT